MELLSLNDFKNSEFGPNCSPFHYLLEVARVGQEKLIKKEEINLKTKQAGIISDNKEKKTHGQKRRNLVFKCKYFQNNTLKLEMIEQDYYAMDSKQLQATRKRKPTCSEEEIVEGGPKKSKKSKMDIPICPNPPPDLPQIFKDHIDGRMGGSGWLLVIQKPIFFSDANPEASRFSVPFSQIKNHEFLYESEAENLKGKKGMQVRLLEPSMAETTVTLKRWNMAKSSMYVLNTTWNSVVENNGLKIGDVVQLWSFRVDSSLCFALVKVDDHVQQVGSEEHMIKSNGDGASSSHEEDQL